MASPGPVSVANGSAKYPYTTLKGPHSFRLLHLVAAPERSDTISCTMQEFDRDSVECPPYTALSYAWGDASNKKHILLDNLPVPVTANLHEALVHLRDVYPDITIWIDALCINQDGLHERGHQVAQMKEIYSKAEKVISWLGPSSEEETPLFDAIRIYEDKILGNTDEAENITILQPDNEAQVRALEHLMTRPYWYRAWVVQEMAVATDLLFMCGNDVLTSDDLSIIRDEALHANTKNWGYIYYEHLFHLREMRDGRLEETNMVKAFMWTRKKEATDPRDNIYAILGLITEGAGRDIEPDYTISECALYAKAIRAVIMDAKDSVEREGRIFGGAADAKLLKRIAGILTPEVERCPESFVLYEDLLRHYPNLKQLDGKSRPQTACSGCVLFDALFTICNDSDFF